MGERRIERGEEWREGKGSGEKCLADDGTVDRQIFSFFHFIHYSFSNWHIGTLNYWHIIYYEDIDNTIKESNFY